MDEIDKYKNASIDVLLHELSNSLTAARHTVWTINNRDKMNRKEMLNDLEYLIEASFQMVMAARENIRSGSNGDK